MRNPIQIFLCLLLVFLISFRAEAQSNISIKKKSIEELYFSQISFTKDDYTKIIEKILPNLGFQTDFYVKPDYVFINFEFVPEELRNQLIEKIKSFYIKVRILVKADINNKFKENYAVVRLENINTDLLIISIGRRIPYVWIEKTYQFKKGRKLTYKIIKDGFGECGNPLCMSPDSVGSDDDDIPPPTKKKIDTKID